jgi:hypothetical protein
MFLRSTIFRREKALLMRFPSARPAAFGRGFRVYC